MKIIDQTPFYNEKGEISLKDRAKAFMQYGRSWAAEMEAQKSVLPALEKVLDKKFTLLRNVTPPGLDTPIPFILVGPTGVYVFYVTPLIGMFRAKGDQWGTISGNAFKPDKTNILARTERMARAVQVHLQRQGYSDLNAVEAILLCANPGIHVDSLRPIVRIVMRDALDRFAISLMQARVTLSPEMVYDVVNRIMNPPAEKEEIPAPESKEIAPTGKEDEVLGDDFNAPAFTPLEAATAPEPWSGSSPPAFPGDEAGQPVPPEVEKPPRRKQTGISRKQWVFLVLMMVVWCILVGIFIFLVVKDLYL